MKTVASLINKIKSLPGGKIYIKTINGKKYYYHQYFQDGKRYTSLVKKEDVKALSNKISQRIELESELKMCINKDKNSFLSDNAKNLTGQVMMGDTPVAEFSNGVLVSLNDSLAPLIIKRTHSLVSFLKYRTIDTTRVNSRLIKKALNINVDNEYQIPLYSYALSISDNYWFKPKKSKLKYKDVNFNNDMYFDISLKGDTTIFPRRSKITPELTTTGSYEKGWKLINDEWWLYKKETEKEIFSELVCYQVALKLGINTAIYEYDDGYIRSKNFAKNVNFEPIVSLVGENDDYNIVFPQLYELNIDIAKDYLKLIAFDSIVNNVDRHNENYGILRDKYNGAIISLAPNFDNNVALISRNTMMNTNPKNNGFISLLVDFLHKNEIAYNLFKEIHLNDIEEKDIYHIIDSLPIKLDQEINDNVVAAIINNYRYLKNI